MKTFKRVLARTLLAIILCAVSIEAFAQGKDERSTSTVSHIRVTKPAVEEFGGEHISLSRVGEIRLVVVDFPPDIEQLGLTRVRVRAAVEKKLLQAGVKLTDKRPRDPVYMDGKRVNSYLPLLLITVTSVNTDTENNVFLIRIELVQDVLLPRDQTHKLSATTWFATKARVYNENEIGRVQQDIGRLLEPFIKAYKAAN